MPLIDLLMAARSAADADHVLLTGNPLNGGGPLNSIESTYTGVGFRVLRTGRVEIFPPTFEFSAASRVCLFSSALPVEEAGSEVTTMRPPS